MPEYYKTNKGYCYKKTRKGVSRISIKDYKKAMEKKKFKKTKNIKQKGGGGELKGISLRQISNNVKLPLLKTFILLFSEKYLDKEFNTDDPNFNPNEYAPDETDDTYLIKCDSYKCESPVDVDNKFDIVDDDSFLEEMIKTTRLTLLRIFQRGQENVRKKIAKNVRERPMGNNKVTLEKNVDYNIYTSINDSNAKIMIDTDEYGYGYTFKKDNKIYTISIFVDIRHLAIQINDNMKKLIEEILKKKGILQTPPPSPFLPRITTPHTADLSRADIKALGIPALAPGVTERVRVEEWKKKAARRAAEKTRPPLSRQLEEQAAQQRAAAEEAARQAHLAAIEDARFGEGGGKRKTKSKKSKKTNK